MLLGDGFWFWSNILLLSLTNNLNNNQQLISKIMTLLSIIEKSIMNGNG
jgi:hypothetical protein